MRLLALLVVLTIVGCGPFNSEFTGTWDGTATASFEGVAPFAYDASITIAVAGDTMTVGRICPMGDGSFQTFGSGDSADWSGTMTCAALPLGGCEAVTIKYRKATISLHDDGTLSARANGDGTGCDRTRNLTMTFTGRKPHPTG